MPTWQPQVPWTCEHEEAVMPASAGKRRAVVHEVLMRLGGEADDDAYSQNWWLRLMRNPDMNVQLLAIEASPSAAGSDSAATVMCELVELARSDEALVRKAALLSLGLMSPKGDGNLIQALSTALEDPAIEVRTIAMQMLPQVADQGDPALLAAVAVRLEHPLSFVRWSAVEVLPRLAAVGDPGLVAVVAARLKSPEAHARQAAVELLPTVSQYGDQNVVRAIARRLADEQVGVRRAAVQAMTRVPRLVDGSLPELLAGSLDHPDERVRWVAVEAMMQASAEPDAVAAVVRGLQDRSRAAREKEALSDGDGDGSLRWPTTLW